MISNEPYPFCGTTILFVLLGCVASCSGHRERDDQASIEIQDLSPKNPLEEVSLASQPASYPVVSLPAGSYTRNRHLWVRNPVRSWEGDECDILPTDPVVVDISVPFEIGKYEVTQALWNAISGSNPARFTECGEYCPIERISWCDAIVFSNALSGAHGLTPVYILPPYADFRLDEEHCSALAEDILVDKDANGYRLPFEDEWEYAARSGSPLEYSGSDEADVVAWYRENSDSTTHVVGQKRRNGFGLHDVTGNVAEWNWDSDGEKRKVYRGGAFDSSPICSTIESSRSSMLPGSRSEGVGLRLVRVVDATASSRQ